MAEIFIYENQRGGTLILRADGDSFVTDIPNLSAVDATISEAQGVGQVGATATDASIQPKSITVSGAVRNAPARAALLAAVLPGVPARLTFVDGSTRRYLEGIPSKSPEISNRRGVQAFQFTLRCSYPYWRGEESPSSLAGLSALFSFPCSLAGEWKISSRSTDVFSTVESPGNMPASFTVRFCARTQVTDPEIYHLES
ncbi:MAG: phage tail family protein, partial [Oscillospiraceae bacterium]|nr:phage tail family protein [Oscillospiraceae bacterium]